MSRLRFTVIIVNYNGGAYVQSALDSLATQTLRDFEVLLIDNASSDGSINNLVTDALPGFRLIAENVNHGFAKANNIAASEAVGEWVVLLNPDAEATPTWLEKVAAGIERNPDVTSFASAQISLNDPTKLDGAGDNYLVWGIPWRGGFGRSINELPDEGECFSACGAGAIYRRDTFLAHQGFDERLFCFCEDVDLGFRLRMMGEVCVYLPDAIIHHAGGGLTGQASDFSVRLGARNRLWIYAKNMPIALLLITLPGHIFLTLAILARGLFTKRFKATWEGLSEGLKDMKVLLAQRKLVQKNRTVSSATLVRSMSTNPFDLLSRGIVIRPPAKPDRPCEDRKFV